MASQGPTPGSRILASALWVPSLWGFRCLGFSLFGGWSRPWPAVGPAMAGHVQPSSQAWPPVGPAMVGHAQPSGRPWTAVGQAPCCEQRGGNRAIMGRPWRDTEFKKLVMLVLGPAASSGAAIGRLWGDHGATQGSKN